VVEIDGPGQRPVQTVQMTETFDEANAAALKLSSGNRKVAVADTTRAPTIALGHFYVDGQEVSDEVFRDCCRT
jgi:hypothetical protein